MLKKVTKKKRTNSKSKQRTKKLKTFNQSDFSLLDDNANIASISDLFKNQVLKKKANPPQNTNQINFNSTVNNYTSVYTVLSSAPSLRPQKVKSTKNIKANNLTQKKKPPQKSKSKSKIISDKKQGKKKKQKKQQKIQSYELIPQSKNSLNSQIVFSTEDTKRQSEESQKRKDESSRIYDSVLSNFTKIKNQDNLVKNNQMLRTTIKQEFKKKNEAATKIQKVFRGFLTRKILQKYIKQQQQKLSELLEQYKHSNGKNEQKSNRSGKSNEFDFFQDRNSISQRGQTPKTFQDEESINLSKIHPSNFKYQEQDSKQQSSQRTNSNRFFNNNKQNQIINCQQQIMSSDESEQEQGEQLQQKSQQNQQNSESQASQASQASQSSQEIIAYRHQQAIYSSSQIQQFLQSSSEQQNQENYGSEKLKKIFNQDQIIFQTNQEHIQSRKNSLFNKDNQPKHKFSNERNNQLVKTSSVKQEHQIMQQSDQKDLDLIKTSKVNSIHNGNRSHKASVKQERQQSSPANKKESDQLQIEQKDEISQKTSKKQNKINAVQKKSLNIKISSSSQSCQTQELRINQMLLQNQSQDLHLQTIKILNDQYGIKKKDQKKGFMDTISYNSQFKAKHQISNQQSVQKASQKKKSFLKKKIYYIEDTSDNADYYESNQKSQITPSNRNGKNQKSQQFSPSNQFQKLKNLQMKRWDEVIKLINNQMNGAAHSKGKNKQFEGFVKQVMQLSLKNKEILNDMVNSEAQDLNSRSSANKHSRIDNLLEQNDLRDQVDEKWKQFKNSLSNGRRKSVTQQDISVLRPTSRLRVSHKFNQRQEQNQQSLKNKPSFFQESSNELKQKINKIQEQNLKHSQEKFLTSFVAEDHLNGNGKQIALLNSIQNDHIQQMLRVREQMLEKRQCQELTKLNQKLIRKEISQKNFLEELKKLTENFQLEKISIDKARQDISKGYSAAVKLIKQAYSDAKKIGYKLPLSKSSDSYKQNKHLGFNVLSGLSSIIIDQLNSKDSNFAMKHIKSINDQNKFELKLEKQNFNKIIPKLNISQDNNKMCYIQGDSSLNNDKDQNICFIRTSNLEFINLPQNNISQSSSSIINNLSSNSFKDQYFDAEHSPKYQPVVETPNFNLKVNKSNMFNQNSGHQFDDLSQDSSEIEFTEEQLRRFRKAQPFDPSIADMNRNLMIGREFIEMQKGSSQDSCSYDEVSNLRNQHESQPQNSKLRLYRQVYEIEQNDNQVPLIPIQLNQRRNDSRVDLITQKQIDYLIFEISCELLMKPLFSQKFLLQKRQRMFGIKKVSDQSRKQFIKIIQRLLPSNQSLVNKLNQNISPLPRQLLKCMRIDFSEQDQLSNNNQQQQQYQQIGKYQMILDQQLCNDGIEKYHQALQLQKQQQYQIQILTYQSIDTLKEEYSNVIAQSINKEWQSRIFNYLIQREKFVKNRKQHCQGIRWEFINMELHCIFDAWNQQIIEIKSNKNGFSGIGLNELTLSMIDRNKKILLPQVETIMELSKFKVMKILMYEDQIINQINRNICGNHEASQNNEFNEQDQISQSRLSLKQELTKASQKYQWIYHPNKQIDEQFDSEQQSKWVYYSDEALSYGLELVYLIEEQIFGQVAKQIRKNMLKIHLI